jgi:hypothetical protein
MHDRLQIEKERTQLKTYLDSTQLWDYDAADAQWRLDAINKWLREHPQSERPPSLDREFVAASIAKGKQLRAQAVRRWATRLVSGKPNENAVAGSFLGCDPDRAEIVRLNSVWSIFTPVANVPAELRIYGTPVWVTPATETTDTVVQARRLSIATKLRNVCIAMWGRDPRDVSG